MKENINEVNSNVSITAKLPSRSILYNLEPIGMGTPLVESLTSYISRLAFEHNVSVSTLLRKKFVQHIDRDYLNEQLSHVKRSKYINGNSNISLEFVGALENLTLRNDIIYMTMNSWSGIFNGCVTDEKRKWCPTCLNFWRNNNMKVYEPLIWNIADINYCYIHENELENNCPKCHKELPAMHGCLIMGYCQYCFTWLGETENNVTKYIPSQDEKSLLSNYQNLITNAPRASYFPTNSTVKSILNRIMVEFELKSKTELAKLLNLEFYTISNWMNKDKLPSPMNLINISSKLNTTIYDLIYIKNIKRDVKKIEDLNCINKSWEIDYYKIESLLKKEVYVRPPRCLPDIANELGVVPISLKKKFPHLAEQIINNFNEYQNQQLLNKKKEIHLSLNEALTSDIPISLAEFSRRYGYSIPVLKNNALTLVNQLIDKNKIYQEVLKKERIEKYTGEINIIISELHQVGIYPSNFQISKRISKPNIFLEDVFRKVRDKILKEYGYKN